MASTAVAIVAVKPILPLYPVLWATAVRLLGGVIGLTGLAIVYRPGRSAFATLVPQKAWRVAVPGAVLGTYLSLVLWVAGFKYTTATNAPSSTRRARCSSSSWRRSSCASPSRCGTAAPRHWLSWARPS